LFCFFLRSELFAPEPGKHDFEVHPAPAIQLSDSSNVLLISTEKESFHFVGKNRILAFIRNNKSWFTSLVSRKKETPNKTKKGRKESMFVVGPVRSGVSSTGLFVLPHLLSLELSIKVDCFTLSLPLLKDSDSSQIFAAFCSLLKQNLNAKFPSSAKIINQMEPSSDSIAQALHQLPWDGFAYIFVDEFQNAFLSSSLASWIDLIRLFISTAAVSPALFIFGGSSLLSFLISSLEENYNWKLETSSFALQLKEPSEDELKDNQRLLRFFSREDKFFVRAIEKELSSPFPSHVVECVRYARAQQIKQPKQAAVQYLQNLQATLYKEWNLFLSKHPNVSPTISAVSLSFFQPQNLSFSLFSG
jgi:hypothetical protein